MARNSMEQLVASMIGSRENPLFPVHGVNTTFQASTILYYAGFKWGGVFA